MLFSYKLADYSLFQVHVVGIVLEVGHSPRVGVFHPSCVEERAENRVQALIFANEKTDS